MAPGGLSRIRRKFHRCLWSPDFLTSLCRSSSSRKFSTMPSSFDTELESINSPHHHSVAISSPQPRRQSYKWRIWIKLTVFIGTLVILSSGVLATVLWLKIRTQLSREIERRLLAVSILRRGEVDDYFKGEIDKMVLISSRIQIINYLANKSGVPAETARFDLQSALGAISEFKSAAIYDTSGSLRIAIGDQSFDDRLKFDPRKTPSTSGVKIELPYLENKIWMYNMTRGIYNETKRIGVLIARINATNLANLIYDTTGLQNTGELLVGVLDDNNTNSFRLVLPPRLNASVNEVPWSKAMIAAATNNPGVIRWRDYRGYKVICAYTPLELSKWVLLAKIDISEAYAPVDNIRVVIIIMIVITLIIGIMASLCVAKIFTAPIIELGRAAAALGEGHMGARVNIVNWKWFRDEIHELQITFNSMAEQIETHQATLGQKVSERTRELAYANHVLASEIEERKRIEVELQMAKDAAVAADKAKSEFLANMSHEIRTPLNGIINCTELCLDTRISAEQKEYLELVRFSAKHLLRIITDILDFSKIEAGKLEMEEIQFSLYDQLEHAVSVLAARAHKKGLEIAWKVDPQVPDQLIGDPGRLFQVFVNLIGNSIKFTEEGEVVVSAQVHSMHKDKVELLFYVRDTGVGIPKVKQSLLFQAFSQVDSSTTRLYGGTGLGLVISSKLALAMSGRMWVESEGRGSTFYFTAWFDIPPECDLPLTPRVESLRGTRVLIVDDHNTSLNIIAGMLQSWGMMVDVATDSEGAKAHLQAAANSGRLFQVLLLDLCLSGNQAVELVHYLWKRRDLLGRTRSGELKPLRNSPVNNSMRMFVEEVEMELPSPASQHRTENQQQQPQQQQQQQQQQACFQNGNCTEFCSDLIEDRKKSVEAPSIIMLTSIEHADAERCRRLGVDLHTSKPIKRALLLQALHAAVGIHAPEAPGVQTSEQVRVDKDTATSKGLRILVAEDNIVNQRVAVSLLKKWGHSTVIACNGAEAVEKFFQEPFDLVLMDVQMPICDGFQATQRIREQEKQRGLKTSTPIIAMTAHAMFGDGERCIAANMDGYISKPLNAKKLQELLQNNHFTIQ